MLSGVKNATARPSADVIAGNIVALPLRDDVADVALAAFVLNHLPDPADGLRELARVTRAGGWVLTSTLGAGNDHPSKALIDDLAGEYGFRAPAWYERLKSGIHQQVSDPKDVMAFAVAAGLGDVRAELVQVRVDASPAELVSWRTGMAHLGPFFRSLSPADAAEFARRAHIGVRDMPPLELAMVALVVEFVRHQRGQGAVLV